MKVMVASLQYSPVFKSLCCALGNQCEQEGHEVKYLFSTEYSWMLSEETKKKAVFAGRSNSSFSALVDGFDYRVRRLLRTAICEWRPDLLYMYNFHPFLNRYSARIVKKCGGCPIQHIHEPYVEDKSAYEPGHRLMLHIFEVLQGSLVRRAGIVVLSSDEAMRLFKKRFPRFSGRLLRIPLLYEDLGNPGIDLARRRYLSFLGPPVKAKGPATFLSIVKNSEMENRGYEFRLISRKAISDPSYLGHRNLRIFFKQNISDEEIGELIKESIAIIAPYRTARQSSVVSTAYMYGVPVIATNIGGLKEVIDHERTGFLVNENAKLEEWMAGIDFVKKNMTELSARCRSHFVEEFSEVNWKKYLDELNCGSDDRIDT